MFKGTGTAIITPFLEDGEVDYNSLKSFVHFQIKNGVEMLIVLGTTGEAPVIEEDEREKIIATVVEANNRKAKVIVGTGTNSTARVVKNNKVAERLGADGVLIVNPYYNKGTQASLFEHYKYIAEKTDLPIILYNVPSRTAINMLPDTMLKIHSDCKNVVAIKEASGDISQIAKLLAAAPETLTVISGNDDQTLPIMALGGKGVISVFSNVFPREMSNLTTAMLEGRNSEALKIHNKYLEMMNLFFIETSPSPVKAACEIVGLCKNRLRMPLLPVTDNSYEVIKLAINKLKA
ncbi:4-hydroxy-tetrahydrodipicolinate synthase [Ignavibacteriales bacterium]